MSLNDSASYYEAIPEARIEERADGSTHIYVGEPRPAIAAYELRSAKTRDVAPVVYPAKLAKPDDPSSGQGHVPESGFTCDFRRSADGRWTGQAGGRRFRLQQSHDGLTYRVTEDRARPWSVRVGDRALADPARPLSAEAEAAGLSRWQGLLDAVWRRKGDTGEAA